MKKNKIEVEYTTLKNPLIHSINGIEKFSDTNLTLISRHIEYNNYGIKLNIKSNKK